MVALRILIVEDDAVIGMLLAEMLVSFGHLVCATENSETDAVRAAIRYRPDLMIVDANLRVGNGISAVQKILRTGFVPHLFVSGDTARIHRMMPDAIVLEKPFRELDLIRSVDRALPVSKVTVAADRAYPSQWERSFLLHDGTSIFCRPIVPADEPQIKSLLSHVSKQDLRFRFFCTIKVFTHEFLASLTQIDYRSAMAFVAFADDGDEILGVVRLHADDAHKTGEFAILLRTDVKGRGLGWELMQSIISYGRSAGLKSIAGQVLIENSAMLDMCRELGFAVDPNPIERDICNVTLTL